MQEVFDKIIEKLEACKDIMLSTKNYDCFGEECKYQDCTVCAFAKAIEIVKQEAAEYNDGWIPCSERLPDESGTYIVNAIENGIVHVTFAKWMPRMKNWNLTGSRSYWKVTAWQPLPPRYQMKRESDKHGT